MVKDSILMMNTDNFLNKKAIEINLMAFCQTWSYIL